MKNSQWIFLSYQLSDTLTAYKNGERIHIIQERSMDEGDPVNQSKISVNLHYGTHIDYPYHFLNNGLKSSDYEAPFFVLDKVKFVTLESVVETNLISIEDLVLPLKNTSNNIQCLIIKTGLCSYRYDDLYWSDNIGINKGVATFCKSLFPEIRFIGFDCMSVSAFHNSMLGREVHKEFFLNNILPIEDMDLNPLDSSSIIKQMIVAPFRVKNAEASPVTVFAKISQND